MGMKILVIEDQKKVASFIKKGLTAEGFVVNISTDGEDGFYQILNNKYDLVILDLMLPKMDGLEVCKKIREKKLTLPIIILTARDTVEDRVSGLDTGADDYLTKPFSFSELLARIKALIRRSQKELPTDILTAGDLQMNLATYEVKRDNKEIQLSSTEFKLLKYLLENKNKVLSKIKILENVWEYDFDPESNIVDVYIKYLRDKIDKGFKKQLIVTIRGIGFKICA